MPSTGDLVPTTRIERRTFIAADLGGKHVLMSVDKGLYLGLDDVGKAIWQHLAEPLTIAALCETLQATYHVSDRAVFERDVIQFLQSLRFHGLIDAVS